MSKETKKSIIKKIKFEYLIIIILSIVAVAIFFSSTNIDLGFVSKGQTQTNLNDSEVEQKLQKTLSKIKGVGDCVVNISFNDDREQVVLKNTETKIENGIKTESSTVVMVNGKPYVVKDLDATVKGVIVVCDGADNLKVKLAITEVITTILDVSSDNIRILKMK